MIGRLRALIRIIPLVVVAVTIASSQASAQSRHDPQLWMQLIVTSELAADWRLHLEAQPRWSEDASELNHVILRGALGRRLHPRVSIWGGYGWIPRTLGPGTRHEHRIWQQLTIAPPPLNRWTPSVRV